MEQQYDHEAAYRRYKERQAQPKLPTDTVKITAVVSRAERDKLNDKARSAELNVSQFVSKLIAESVIEAGYSEHLRELNIWLSRINANLNMLAKIGNMYKERTDADLMAYNLGQIRDGVLSAVKTSVPGVDLSPKRLSKKGSRRKKQGQQS